MVDLSLPKKAFKAYELEAEARLGMDMDYFSQIVSRAKADDELQLSLGKEKSSLLVTLKGTATRDFSVPLLDISKNEAPNPKIEFDAMITLRAPQLQDALKDAALVSSHVSIGVENSTFFVKAQSSKGTLNHQMDKAEHSFIEFSAKKNAKSMFPLDYLQDMLKAAESDTPLTLELKTDAQIKISYPIGQAQIFYFLAPRIENE